MISNEHTAQPAAAEFIFVRSEAARAQHAAQVARAEHMGEVFTQFGRWISRIYDMTGERLDASAHPKRLAWI